MSQWRVSLRNTASPPRLFNPLPCITSTQRNSRCIASCRNPCNNLRAASLLLPCRSRLSCGGQVPRRSLRNIMRDTPLLKYSSGASPFAKSRQQNPTASRVRRAAGRRGEAKVCAGRFGARCGFAQEAASLRRLQRGTARHLRVRYAGWFCWRLLHSFIEVAPKYVPKSCPARRDICPHPVPPCNPLPRW